MPPERIVPLPSSENFWSVGGPAVRPDSEMYWDWGEEVGCGRRLPRLHALRALPRVREPRLHVVRAPCRRHAHRAADKNIDTGWGLERVARVVQDVPPSSTPTATS
jgi:Alanyl-tRNA synthetase